MELRNGVAAFDPVTLRIAADQLPTVQLPDAFDAEMPEDLAALATVEVSPFDVTARIDTGQLVWAGHAETKSLTAYDGREVSGVELSGAKVAELSDAVVARVNIKLDDRKLRAWFAEIPAETELESVRLVTDVRRWMKDFSTEDKKVDTLTVPQQNVDYEAFVKGLDRSTRQSIKAVVDERGARVVAETTIVTGSLPSWGAPKHVVLGERGPVLFWFSEGNENKALPFAVVYTQAEAWVGA